MAELKQSYDEHFALIIGINEYDNLNNLEYAVNDAKSIYKILTEKFKYKKENVKLILDKEANKSNIMQSYYEISKSACNDDSVLIFYAGHGTTYQAGLRDKGYLVPCDGTEENLNTMISWDSLIDDSELFRAKHIFYIMDACYSGLALQRSTSGSKRFLKDMMRRYSRQVLTSGKSDQKVKDSGGKNNNSIFTSYLLDALNGEAKTEYGVLSASSVMNYVYNKVSNDIKSYQTPGCGSFYGEGDFIFNYEEINKMIGENSEKDNDILVEIPQIVSNRNDNDEFEIELKKLLSDDKNYIKINDLINEEIKIYLQKFNPKKLNLNDFDKEFFKSSIIESQDNIKKLLISVILLSYYGDNKYIKLIKKIIYRVYPNGIFSGNSNAISLLYFPTLILIYGTLISSLESENYELIKEIVNITYNNVNIPYYNQDNNSLIVKLFDEMTAISRYFNLLYSDNDYKYPMNEYLYKYIQPLIDDILFIGDEYSERYINTEMLISIAYAIKNYDDKGYVYGPVGRYLYILNRSKLEITKLPINEVIEKIGLYDELSNKEDFIDKYNKFLREYFF